MSKQSNLVEDAVEQIELAYTYFDDGAPRSAARCLRKAADLLEQHADNCDAALGDMS